MKEKLPTDSILAQRICSAEEVLKYAIDHCLPVVQYVETYQGNSRHYNWGDCITPHFSGKNHYVLRALFCLAAVGRKKKCRWLHKMTVLWPSARFCHPEESTEIVKEACSVIYILLKY